MPSSHDIYYMRYALGLARRGLGRTAPNPSVGCVIVKNDNIIGVGHTADRGRPHAETIALKIAGDKAQGADVYVTLEPCSHHGQTPPCAQTLIDAKVARVFVSCTDPNPKVSGSGIKMLQNAGIKVIEGICESEAAEINKGFFFTQTENRPFITLKTALSTDGKTALPNGQSQWITNSLSRRKAHQLRSQHDAILCGIGTVNADDPMLNTRVDGLVHKAVRIVLDTALSIDLNSKLVQSARNEPLWIIHDTHDQTKIDALETAGAKLFKCNPKDLGEVLKVISQNGVTRLMVEGGAVIHSFFITAGLYDELAVFTGSKIIGAGLDAFSQISFENMSQVLQLQLRKTILLEDNVLNIYRRKAQS